MKPRLLVAIAVVVALGGPTTSHAGVQGTCHGLPANGTGTNKDEDMFGSIGDDVFQALGGDDIVHGRRGVDIICGGSGADQLYGGFGNDTLYGGPTDELFGGPGTDTCIGPAKVTSCEK